MAVGCAPREKARGKQYAENPAALNRGDKDSESVQRMGHLVATETEEKG